MRHLLLGTKFVTLGGNAAKANVGFLTATVKLTEDIILNWLTVQYCAGVYFLPSAAGDVDYSGAFIVENNSSPSMSLNNSNTVGDPGILWSRNDAFCGTAGAVATNPVITASADIQFPGKLLRQGTSISLYLINPLNATTQVNYGVQATLSYWSLSAYKHQATLDVKNSFAK